MHPTKRYLLATPQPRPRRNKLATALASIAVAGALLLAPHANTQTAPVNLSTIWWVPSESGWGLNLTEQGNIVFLAWYTYDVDGKALWLSGAFSKQANGSFVGDLFRFSGTAFDKISGAASTGNMKVGAGTLTSTADGALQFAYSIGTTSQTKRLERFRFSATTPNCTSTTASRANATNFQDIWFNETESGWGLSLIHQGTTVFAAWYTYRADGTPQWLSAITALQAGTPTKFSGQLVRTAGIPLLNINGAAAATGTPASVGTVDFTFTNGETGTMVYTLDGVTQTKPIKRFVFSSPQTVCADTPASVAEVPADAAKLNAYLISGQYKSWNGEPAVKNGTSAHQPRVRAFANPILEAAIKQSATNYPIGSATVKELYTGSDVLQGWAVAVKTANNRNPQDWYWYEVFSTAPGGSPVVSSNGASGCVGCHSAGTDYVRTRFPF